jgi:hypothetical protein
MAKSTGEVEVQIHKPNSTKVKQGDIMALVTYVKVDATLNNGTFLKVSNVDQEASAKTFEIHGKDIIEGSFSADQFEEEVKVTKTKLAEILVSSHNRPFTVDYDKDDGTPRTLRGRLIHPEPLLGRSKVEDFDIKDSNRVRLVDHRTIRSLIVNGVKYTVK